MTVYTPSQLYSLWVSMGGGTANALAMVAIAEAESGGDSNAISPTNDYGLWQINESNFGTYGLTASQALDPYSNAAVAIAMSGDGSNVGPWCTAWADPGANCGRPLAHIQSGSAAYPILIRLALQNVGPAAPGTIQPGSPHPGLDKVTKAWGEYQDFAHAWGADYTREMQSWAHYSVDTRGIPEPERVNPPPPPPPHTGPGPRPV